MQSFRINLNDDIAKYIAEVEKQNIRNNLAVFTNVPALVADLKAYAQNVRLDGIALEDIHYSVQRIEFDRQINDYLFYAGYAYHSHYHTRELIPELKLDKDRYEDYSELEAWIASADTDFLARVERDSGISKASIINQLQMREQARKKETLQAAEIKKVAQALDLRALLIGLLRSFGYSLEEMRNL